MVQVKSNSAENTLVTSTQEPSFSEMMEQMRAMQQEIAELKSNKPQSEADKVKKAKEKYNWPLQACYQMWGGVPVLSYKSVKKDAEQDLLYKDPVKWVWVDNHYLELMLADGSKTKPILRQSYAQGHVKSDYLEFDIIDNDGTLHKKPNPAVLVSVSSTSGVKSYVFPYEGGEINVLPSCVN